MELDLEEVARPIPMPMPYSKPLHPSQKTNNNNNYNNKYINKPSHSKPPARVIKPAFNQASSYSSSNSTQRQAATTTNKGDRSMRNPEKLVYLMRAGHNARSAGDASANAGNASANSYAGDAGANAYAGDAGAASLARPALNSTAHLQRQAQALAAEVFEEDDEAMAEYERRTKHSEIKVNKTVIDFAPTEQRYVNLIPLETGTPLVEALPRRVIKPPPPPSQHSSSRPSISGPCFENIWDDGYSNSKVGTNDNTKKKEKRTGVVTRSVYVQPMTTPSYDHEHHPSLRDYLNEHRHPFV